MVGKRKRSLSMSSSGTTISTLREMEREKKHGMKEIKKEWEREREINEDKTVKTDGAKD